MKYELKVTTPEGATLTVTWSGKDGLDACHRYANVHPGMSVIAWREAEQHGIFPGMPNRIVEPGEK